MPPLRAALLALLFVAPSGWSSGPESIVVAGRIEWRAPPATPPASLRLELTVAYFSEAGWSPDAIAPLLQESAVILSQCGIELHRADLLRIEAPAVYRDFFTPLSRQLARALPKRRPAVFFVAGSRQRPAFDAEAVGRGNSGTRPELRDTVWVTRAARDPGIAMAHEIAHVLMDSGEHADEPGNLMRDETAPGQTRLSEPQCARLRERGSENGLLRPAS